VAVYCGSSIGNSAAFSTAAESLGSALAAANRTLVYGGGSKGIMGIVSGSVLEHGGKVIGVIPQAMVAAGGEKDKVDENDAAVQLNEIGRETAIDSMHERKVQMALRSAGFVGLPGGFGTFEEVLEVTTWTQLGIHDKPVVLLNVLSFWDPLRILIKSSIEAGFIKPSSERLIVFVDGPADKSKHEHHNWGKAALEALDGWQRGHNSGLFKWDIGSKHEVDFKETYT
ncbi:hypothetical protein HYPSUDRAFT_144807, partial [Hypholoma sublateritium FD-334 SS-4]